ncbi:MAG: hypothetical protein IJ325_12940 [Clostridia bacterium]|nr:hypothetical protein [Clostridia bacterium]
MYLYSINRLLSENFDEIVQDVREQVEQGVATVPLFHMSLVPEGNPVYDKASHMCELYGRFRDALKPYGINPGILVQSSLGHGYALVPNPFQKYVNLSNGKEIFCCCPEDPAYIEHFSGVMKQLAMEHPAAIMLDDDFRMTVRDGRGCACPRHMKLFNERTGLNMTREELWEYIKSHPYGDPITVQYLETQTGSLVKAAAAFRAAIDSVDPTIQGINCTSGPECDSVIYTNPIFAGKGNPTIVRVPNGSYAPFSTRYFSGCINMGARTAAKLKKHGIDVVLAETDTIPWNRYGKSARYLHAQFSASLAEGMQGAKHWLSRPSIGEQASGRAYRKILSEHRKFYEKLAEYGQNIKWVGINSLSLEKGYTDYNLPAYYFDCNEWISYLFDRIGIPFYFSENMEGTTFVNDRIIEYLTDDQIEQLFETSVFFDNKTAEAVISRGFGDRLGIDMTDWDLGKISNEVFGDVKGPICTKQKNAKRIIVSDDSVETLSYNFVLENGCRKLLSPAVTVKENNGKLAVAYCGTPVAIFDYTEGFAFLNETRKKQFISLLKRAGCLPVYYPGDNEICLRAGYLPDGRMLVMSVCIGVDPMDEYDLYLEKKPSSIRILNSDGTETEVEWTEKEDGMYTIKVRVECMYPVVLLVE